MAGEAYQHRHSYPADVLMAEQGRVKRCESELLHVFPVSVATAYSATSEASYWTAHFHSYSIRSFSSTLNSRLGYYYICHSLPRSMATIHSQIRPRHERTRITDQEHRRPSVLLRLRQTAQHVLRRPLFFSLWVLHEQFLHHCRHNVSGRDGVDANVVLAPFRRQVTCELHHTGFRRIVCRADEALARTLVGERGDW